MSRKGVTFLIVVGGLGVGAAAIALFGPGDAKDDKPNSKSSARSGSPSPSRTTTLAASEISIGPVPETQTPPAPPGAEGYQVWSGPDDAVATWNSSDCGSVLRYGAQLYLSGGTTLTSPPEGAEYLGYHSGYKALWGDRGTPDPLYITDDGGKSFTDWTATDRDC